MDRRILVIDNDNALTAALGERLSGKAIIERAPTGGEGIAAFRAFAPHIVILEKRLPDRCGIEVLKEIKSLNVGAYVVFVAEPGDMETTVEVIKKGAFDFIARPLDMEELEIAIRKAFKNIDLHARLKDLLSEVYREYRVDAIIGKSRAMEEIFKTIGLASQGKITVLIQGESGTGKELIARAIHYNSAERDKPFVAINCSALVETLLESELFGHEKGAFTGALFRKEGKFEAASGGTVFLDEIGEMSQALQVKLLRVLQERSFERVGGSETIRTDVRVIAAANKDLKELTARGLFREDLYYRLKVLTIEVPPLRERKEDIPLLVSHLLEKAGREFHKKVGKVPVHIMERLMSYPWPGNVRELENVITRGVLLAKGDVLLDVYLPGISETDNKREGAHSWNPSSLDQMERHHIGKTLEHTGWNKTRAAGILGVSLPRLERKIRKYGLHR